ncbi:MAG: hypothetical protein QXT14_02895 [Candidatus Bathyarchaeia archaeon]
MEIKEEYEKLKATLYTVAPFISSLLSRARVVVNRSVKTAGVSPSGVIVINPDFWLTLDWSGKAWLITHELLHLAMRDHRRMGGRNAEIWNICADHTPWGV